MYINGEAVVTDVTANDGLWHHIVVTWSNLLGEWHIYKDGDEEAMGDGLAVGTFIQGKINLMIPFVPFMGKNQRTHYRTLWHTTIKSCSNNHCW